MNINDILLEPLNWSATYGPYSSYSWKIYKESCEDYAASWVGYDIDALFEERECYMDYSSMEVI